MLFDMSLQSTLFNLLTYVGTHMSVFNVYLVKVVRSFKCVQGMVSKNRKRLSRRKTNNSNN